MPEQPPMELVALLEGLGLANATQVAKMARRVGRLARDLPRFESVWVDALSQARVLTAFQAAEINAGRGQALRVGPYVLCERLAHPYYVGCYRARRIASKEYVRLAVVENVDARAGELLRQMEGRSGQWPAASGQCDPHPAPLPDEKETDRVSPRPLAGEGPGVRAVSSAVHSTIADSIGCVPRPSSLVPSSLFPLPSPLEAGTDGLRLFAAEPWIEGRTAAEWIVHHGRVPPQVVLEIARAMLAQLAELDRVGICHGDVSVSSLLLTEAGDAMLVLPGLRGILRPEEGYAHANLAPEAYDSMAPERVATGCRPDAQSDMYACGCVWWHLLCGRPPLVGGNAVAKLRAAQSGEIGDVRHYAPETPATLASAISACLEREPGRRPESFARLAAMLGPSTRGGKETLRDHLARAGRPAVPWTTTVRAIRRSRRTPLWLAGAVCCAAVAVAMLWPVLQGHSLGGSAATSTENSVAKRPEVSSGLPILPAAPKSEAEPLADSQVVPVAYREVEKEPEDLVLADDSSIDAASLALKAGQCVRGEPGHRATVRAPDDGLVVDKEGVRFENIDFLWRTTSPSDDAKRHESAMVRLLAGDAEFRGCSFRCETSEEDAPAAVRWVHPAQAGASELALPNGKLRMADCLMQGVEVGLDCHTIGALAIVFDNTLHVESGPLVRLERFPQADEPVAIALTQVTLRDTGPLLECCMSRIERQPGEIAVQATACAFVPAPRVPLLHLLAIDLQDEAGHSASYDRLLAAVRWTGQGSLVAPRTPIAAWTGPDGKPQDLEDSSISIAGLVRSDVEFAGPAASDPAASCLTRWQAPLQTADAPGIDPTRLLGRY